MYEIMIDIISMFGLNETPENFVELIQWVFSASCGMYIISFVINLIFSIYDKVARGKFN